MFKINIQSETNKKICHEDIKVGDVVDLRVTISNLFDNDNEKCGSESAGDEYLDEFKLAYNIKGQYRLVPTADSRNQVPERNEQNNGSNTTINDRSEAAGTNSGLIIQVNDKGKINDSKTYFTILPKANLLSVKSKESE